MSQREPVGSSQPSWIDVAAAEVRCMVTTARLLASGRLVHRRALVGSVLRFRDGSASVVYRETVARLDTARPALLVVEFTLRLLGTGPRRHAAFRAESWLNLVLFAGYEGFRTKLWLGTPRTGAFRGVYEWDGPAEAVAYAERLVRILRLVSLPGTVRYHVVPGTRRDDFLLDPRAVAAGAGGWWSLDLPIALPAGAAPGQRPVP